MKIWAYTIFDTYGARCGRSIGLKCKVYNLPNIIYMDGSRVWKTTAFPTKYIAPDSVYISRQYMPHTVFYNMFSL